VPIPPDPPLVHLVRDDEERPVFMLGWARYVDGSWWARVTWIDDRGAHPRPRAEWVPAGALRPIQGEDYRRLPRVQLRTAP
jgi:hypothetical protein